MIIRAIVLAGAAEVFSVEEQSQDWVAVPATPIGHAYNLRIQDDYLYVKDDAGWKVKKADGDSWALASGANDCEFFGKYGVCGYFGAESDLDSIRYIDFGNGGRQSRIAGFVAAIREAKLVAGDTSVFFEQSRSTPMAAISAGESGLIMMAIPYDRLGCWAFLASVDTVFGGGNHGKRWRFAGLLRVRLGEADSLTKGPRFVDKILISNNVVYVSDGLSEFRSADSGKTWNQVSCFPWGDDRAEGAETIIGRCKDSGVIGYRLGVSIDNGRNWVSRNKSITWPTETRYRDGAIWRYTVEEGRVFIEVSRDLGLSWVVIRDESRDWGRLRGWGVSHSGDLYVLGGKYQIFRLNPEGGDFVAIEKSHFPGKIKKARFVGSDIYILQRGWVGDYPGLIESSGADLSFQENTLLRFRKGRWEVLRTNISDFEAADSQIFVVDMPRQIGGPASPGRQSALRTCDGPQLWEFSIQELSHDDQGVERHTNSVVADCQYSDRGLSVNYEGTYGFLWASRNGCIQFALGAGYPAYGERMETGPFAQSCNAGRSWFWGGADFEPLPLIDTGRVLVDSMFNIYVKNDQFASALSRRHQHNKIMKNGQKLYLELSVQSDVRVEFMSLDGKLVSVAQESNMNPGVHQFVIPRIRGVGYARVTTEGQANVVTLAPTMWGH